MADVTLDPTGVSADGLTVPVGDVKGKPKAGSVVTLGTKAEDETQWEVLRVDADEGVVHLVRTDRVAELKKEHRKSGHKDDGSIEVS